jgi:transposase
MSERHSMRQIREVLRLKNECKQSHRLISCALGISKGSVSDYLQRAQRAGLTWSDASALSDAEVEQRLFEQVGVNEPAFRAPINYSWVHAELRKTGVTLQLLWTEYREGVEASGANQRAYQYSQFCDLYGSYRKRLTVCMRQAHRAGEKGFVDYSGKRPCIVDSKTGAVTLVELFLMVLGASNYTYCEATRTQRIVDFVGSTVRAFEYFGCVPEILVPDQLRSAVKKPHRYTPEINETYAELARHYAVTIVPARPRKPRDKAKVEAGVLLAQRWILACLRNRTFFSLEELNGAIRELLEKLNTRPFQRLEGCRRSAFESIDRPAMRPLPPVRYLCADWKKARVGIDHHVMYDERPYSAPHTLIGQAVEVRATTATVELFHGGERVASHQRCFGPSGTATTLEEHRPKSHREYGAWPPSRMLSWAAAIGPGTERVTRNIVESTAHPELSRRNCMALFRSGKTYGKDRLEAACLRAIEIGAPTRKSVDSILANGLDRVPADPEPNVVRLIPHENIRGGDYFDMDENADRALIATSIAQTAL